jgi:hypothetical protein
MNKTPASKFARLTVLCLGLLFYSHVSWGGSFTLKDLEYILKEKNSSIEEIISALPDSMRENFTFMKESQSTQGASPNSPRAIVFGKDSKLVMTFNGDPTQAGYDIIEVMAFNETTK